MQLRFAHDERVYKAFLEILNMYRKGQKTINQVYEEVMLPAPVLLIAAPRWALLNDLSSRAAVSSSCHALA